MSTDRHGQDRSGLSVWPGGHDLILLDSCDSTMSEAATRAPEIDRPTWIMARRQTAARGRRGKVWEMPEGNLAATLIFKPYCTPAEAARRSFMAANALLETLSIFTDRARLSLKWPNDVLLDEGKVAGILLESSGTGPFVDWLAVGIGVNLRAAPQGDTDAPFPPVSLGLEDTAPAEVLAILASNFATQEAKLASLGFNRIREDWLAQAARLGEQISARTTKETVRGTFDTIDGAGNLVLITGTGPRAIPAADVFFE